MTNKLIGLNKYLLELIITIYVSFSLPVKQT